LESVRRSNNLHKDWPRRKLQSLLGNLLGRTIAVLGLTYKPGTDTLRRSGAIELCHWLLEQGAIVRAFDPAVAKLPEELNERVSLCRCAVEAFQGCDAAVFATDWPQFRELAAQDLIDAMNTPVVLDASRFLERTLAGNPALVYVAVGMPRESA